MSTSAPPISSPAPWTARRRSADRWPAWPEPRRWRRCTAVDEADAEIRATALEPVGPADFPDTLVARLTRVQGLVAAARGDDALAERRLGEAADGWRRITDRGRGDRMHAVVRRLRAARDRARRAGPRARARRSRAGGSAMPQFRCHAITTSAPPEEVWKLLYDASRFAEWWEGIETSEVRDGGATIYPDGYPDFPMPQAIEASRDGGGRVRISCLVSDIRFEWRLAEHAGGTRISVDVEVPEEEAQRFDRQREVAQILVTYRARRARDGAAEALGAAAQAGGAGLLARAVVPVQRAALDGLVDRLHEARGARRRPLVVAVGDGGLEAAEVGLDRGGVAAVLLPLALGAEDALLLRVDVGHDGEGAAVRAAAARAC